ncbi:MAG: ABC transporter permease [Tumebacillaceae bacterium]
MGNLLRIEFLKIRRRPRTWIMAILMILVMAVFAPIAPHLIPAPEATWKQDTIKANEDIKQLLASNSLPEEAKVALRAELAMNTYNIEHDLPKTQGNAWRYLDFSSGVLLLTTVFVIIIAGDTISSEFSWGTIKLLLIRPTSRSKIMYSKYIAALVMSVLFTLLTFVGTYVIGGLFFGFGGFDQPYAYLNPDGIVQMTTLWKHVVLEYGVNLLQMVMYVTLAIMLSAVFRSSAMAIAIPALLLLSGPQLILFLKKNAWVKYTLMANTNVLSHIEGPTLFQGTTLGFSIGVLAMYFVVFHWIAWYTFNKRDVAA